MNNKKGQRNLDNKRLEKKEPKQEKKGTFPAEGKDTMKENEVESVNSSPCEKGTEKKEKGVRCAFLGNMFAPYSRICSDLEEVGKSIDDLNEGIENIRLQINEIQSQNKNNSETGSAEVGNTISSVDNPDVDIPFSLSEKISNLFVPYKRKYVELESKRKTLLQLKDVYAQINLDCFSLRMNSSVDEKESNLQRKQERLDQWDKVFDNIGITADPEVAKKHIDKLIIENNNLTEASYDHIVKNYGSVAERYKTLEDALNKLSSLLDNEGRTEPSVCKDVVSRSLKDVLERPNSEERGLLLRCFYKKLKDGGVPVQNNFEETVKNIKSQLAQVEDLKTQREKLEKINPEDLAKGILESGNYSEEFAKFLISTLQAAINNKINDESKKLHDISTLEDLYGQLGISLQNPENHDDAIRMGEDRILSAVAAAVGVDSVNGNTIDKEIFVYHEKLLKRDLLDRLEGVSEDDKASLDRLVTSINREHRLAEEAVNFLSEYEADKLKGIPSKIVSRELEKLKDTIIGKEEAEEVKALVKVNSLEILFKKIVELFKQEKNKLSKAEELRKKSDEQFISLGKNVVEKAGECLKKEHLELRSSDPLEAVLEVGRELSSMVESKDKDIDFLEKNVAENEKKMSELDKQISEKNQALIDFISAYVFFIKGIFRDMEDSIKMTYEGKDRSSALPKAVDEKILQNDFYGLEEFYENVVEKIEKSNAEKVKDLNVILKDSFIECLKIPSATWIDNLARLFLYSKVPFISQQFLARNFKVENVFIAFGLLKSILSSLGIELHYPNLFAESYDENKYETEAIRNIDGYVTGLSEHVVDDDLVIDLFSIGYSVDGNLKSKPIVSRFKN